MNSNLSFSTIQNLIKKAWDAKTCFPVQTKEWNESLPELGQCAVTALLVQDYLGGDIAFNKTYNHFWNILSDGEEIDLTKNQFKSIPRLNIDSTVTRQALLNSESADRQRTKARYELLKKRVKRLESTLPVSLH